MASMMVSLVSPTAGATSPTMAPTANSARVPLQS